MKTRYDKVKLVLPALAFALVAFAAADVAVDYNHHADMGKYHTYSWIGVTASSIWQERITTAVDAQLSAKGWQRVASGGDAAVSAVGHVTEHDTLETFYTGFPGWGWRGWAGMGATTTTVVPEKVGNLTVDIFDGASKELVWRGRASDAVSSKPEKNEKRMEESVDKMFKNFPPQSRG